MRKFLAIGLVLLLAAGVVFDRSIGDEPAIDSEAPTSVASVDQLATLGPIDLINNTYTVQIDAGFCGFLGWVASFNALAVGSTGTITSTSNGFFLGVTVVAGGPTSFGDCVSGTVLGVVTGNIDGGAHTYSVTVVAR